MLTHKTAVVLIPPPEVWEPIQAIRRRYDRQVRRWMPHVTLLYPFLPGAEFAKLPGALAEVCRAIQPFPVTLARFHCFEHAGGNATLWLAPEQPEPLLALHAALLRAFPECADTAAHPAGFTPHLSVGQARGERALQKRLAELREHWQPLTFRATEVSLIARGDPPDDAFAVAERVGLGGGVVRW